MNISAMRLRMLRQQMGLSQQKVADAIGITRTAYNKYESGAIRPNQKIRELCDLFHVSADYIRGNDETSKEEAAPPNPHADDQIRKYLGLSDSGRSIVDITLDAVYQLERKKSKN